MNNKHVTLRGHLLGFSLSTLSLAVASAAHAQSEENETSLIAPPVMEETQVIGRLVTGAENLAIERQEQAVATDYIGADQIGRIGDSTVALALTRVPGVTLIDNKFVYVRGLGERYASTTLNGAMVPSPDLSRNVLPLDIFPTSIVESLAIQKVPSADKPAAFGGGSVDIRTTGIPEDFLFHVELGTGFNTQADDVLTYDGGEDDRWGQDDGTRALSDAIDDAIGLYRGNFNANNIRNTDSLDSLGEAREVNRNLATELNRDVTVYEDDAEPDIDAEINLGNVFYLPSGMEFGFLAGAAYDSGWGHEEIVERNLTEPDQQFALEEESTYSVSVTGNLGLGFKLNSENSIETTSLYLRNTDDETSVRNYFNANRQLASGRGFRETELRYEERELEVHQVHGKHELGGETLDVIGLDALSFLEGLSFNWYVSDSEASTDLPNEVTADSDIQTDPETGVVQSSSLGAGDSAVTYRFSALRDYVDSNGWTLAMPFELHDFEVEVSGGMDYWQKSRTYEQLELYLGSSSISGSDPVLRQPLGQVLSDDNILNPDYGFQLSVSGDNANSYIAANKVNAAFGKLDVTWDYTLRAVVGVRWEDYQQVNLPWDPIEFDGSQFPGSESGDPEKVADYFRNATYANDDTYVSAALTWMLQDFWAQDFQLRASYGETTVRPDLREIASSNYRDPLTGISVTGSPDVVPSTIDNWDLRAEWFFSNGDNFTASLFYKDIQNPIEMFEAAAADDNIAAEIHNAESAELTGVEFEFLKTLGDVADVLEPFFVQGNLTLLDQELVVGDRADAATNAVRPLQGASDQVLNIVAGFDSYDGKHAATVSYNAFSERLFFAGRLGKPDSYEQPFQSLDFTYSYYPTNHFTVKFKAQNLLDEELILERTNVLADGTEQDVEVYSMERGQDFSLSVSYQF